MAGARVQIVICAAVLLGSLASRCLGAVFPDSTSKLEGASETKIEERFWGELYSESMISWRDRDNLVSSSHIRQGLTFRLPTRMRGEVYLLLRHGGGVGEDFRINRLEAGIGLRARPAWKVFLVPYLELILGRYLEVPDEYPQPQESDYRDLRSGLLFWHGWEGNPSTPWLAPLTLRYWWDLYGDVSYHRNPESNIVGYFHAKIGSCLLSVWRATLGAYGVAYVMKDVHQDFWNNKAEIGPAIRLTPLPDLNLMVSVEWLRGSYFGLEGEDPNPYGQRYGDRRAAATLWIGW